MVTREGDSHDGHAITDLSVGMTSSAHQAAGGPPNLSTPYAARRNEQIDGA